MTEASARAPRKYAQFSLRAIMIVVTLGAVATWYWWWKPYEVESTRQIPAGLVVGKRVTKERTKVESRKREGFTDNVRHGPTKVYDEDGDLISQEDWQRGMRHGLYRKWDEKTGDLIVDVEFKNGKIVRIGENEVTTSLLEITDDSPAAQRMKRALDQEVWFDYLDQPLTDVVDDISFNHNLPILLDTRALATADIPTDLPSTIELRSVPLSMALAMWLAPRGLTCAYEYDLLWITTPDSPLHGESDSPRVNTTNASPQVLNALEREAHFDYLRQPLGDVFKDIAFTHSIQVDNELSPDSLQQPITRQLKGLSLRSSLGTLFYDCGLRCEAQADKLVVLAAEGPISRPRPSKQTRPNKKTPPAAPPAGPSSPKDPFGKEALDPFSKEAASEDPFSRR
jgi:hypothetical protein